MPRAKKTGNNPAVSPEQYRLAQAVLSGSVRTPSRMSKAAAREIIDKTPAHLRSEWSRSTTNRRTNRRNPADEAAQMYEAFHGAPSTGIVEIEDRLHFHEHLAELGVLVGLKVRLADGRDLTLEYDFAGSSGNPKRKPRKGPLTQAYEFGTGIIPGMLTGADKALGGAIGNRRRRNPPNDSGPVLLCSNEAGNQLYFRGGDQSIDLAKIGLDEAERDLMVIGEAWAIAYSTKKDFDDFAEIQYVHVLGSEKNVPKIPKSADLWEDQAPPEKSFGTGELPILLYDRLNERIEFAGGIYKIEKPMFETSPGIVN